MRIASPGTPEYIITCAPGSFPFAFGDITVGPGESISAKWTGKKWKYKPMTAAQVRRRLANCVVEELEISVP